MANDDIINSENIDIFSDFSTSDKIRKKYVV